MSNPSAADQIGVYRDLAYGLDPQQKLDLYIPSETPARLTVFVHGGAWKSGSRHEFDAAAYRLKREGRAVATVDYRLSPGVKHPAHAEDVAQALAWLRKNARKYDFIGTEIVAVGHSAGAHILATIATSPELATLASCSGFVGLEGIYDIPKLAERWPTYPDWFLKKAFGPEAGWAAASPSRAKLATKAPWLLVHSKVDELVDLGQTDDFAKHLSWEGVSSVMKIQPDDKTHDDVVRGLAFEDDEVSKWLDTFDA